MALIAFALLVLIFATPTAFFGMLFLGNLGINISFIGCLPGAIALRGIMASFNNNGEKK